MKMRYVMQAGAKLLTVLVCLAVFQAVGSAAIVYDYYDVFGNMPSFAAGSSGTTSAAQFNSADAWANAHVQTSCPVGYTCGPLTLYEIDFSLSATTSATLNVNNTTGKTGYIQAIPGTGSFLGGATSGTALAQVTTIYLTDPLGAVADQVIPTFSRPTDVQGKLNLVTTPCTGTASSGNWVNCMTVTNGPHTYTGTGSDTGTNSFSSADDNWSTERAPYIGSGNVDFTLLSTGATSNGTTTTGVDVASSATVNSLSNALQVTYLYSYTETENLVPEPATFLMLGSALIAIASMLKRRRHKA